MKTVLRYILVLTLLSSNWALAQDVEVDQDSIYEFVDVQPEFPGGAMELSRFVTDNFMEDDNCEYDHYNKIYLSFVVGRDGYLHDVKSVHYRQDNDCFKNEIIRIFKGMPAWKPGELGGKPVSTRMIYPVTMTFN